MGKRDDVKNKRKTENKKIEREREKGTRGRGIESV